MSETKKKRYKEYIPKDNKRHAGLWKINVNVLIGGSVGGVFTVKATVAAMLLYLARAVNGSHTERLASIPVDAIGLLRVSEVQDNVYPVCIADHDSMQDVN